MPIVNRLTSFRCCSAVIGGLCVWFTAWAQQQTPVSKAIIDGTAAGWYTLDKEHFVNVNCNPDTGSTTIMSVASTAKSACGSMARGSPAAPTSEFANCRRVYLTPSTTIV